MNPLTEKREPIIRVYEGIEYEILELTDLTSPLCGTSCGMIAAEISIEEDEHEDRVLQAKKARAAVKRLFRVAEYRRAS